MLGFSTYKPASVSPTFILAHEHGWPANWLYSKPRGITPSKYIAIRIRIMPLTRRIIVSLSWKTSTRPALVSIIATETYQKASIAAAMIPMKTVSAQLESGCTRWLNTARKNMAIFGLRRDIRKPWPTPRSNVSESISPGPICWTTRRSLAVIVRNPIYARRHAPENCKTNKMPDWPTITSATPTAVRNAHQPMPIECPRLVAIP